jgi:hypothetical protein
MSIFKTKVQIVVTMLSQILGLENDRTITKVILGFLLTMDSTNEKKIPQIQVAKFLSETIHTQLVNLNIMKNLDTSLI